jgi:hypothetical protein
LCLSLLIIKSVQLKSLFTTNTDSAELIHLDP